MTLILQSGFCLLFCLIVCFYVGKKWGERKYQKIKDELKAHELAFSQLLERMEMLSSHNANVLEAKTEELRELTLALDKKLIYANDILKDLDKVNIAKINSTALLKHEPPVDLKFRREINEIIAEYKARIAALELRLEALEMAERKRVLKETSMMVERKVKSALESPSSISSEVSGDLIVQPSTTTDSNSNVIEVEAEKTTTTETKEKVLHLQPYSHIDTPLGTDNLASEGLQKNLRGESQLELFRQILDLQKKGVSLPQIARKLNIGHGEVKLIMRFYGSNEPLRKVT